MAKNEKEKTEEKPDLAQLVKTINKALGGEGKVYMGDEHKVPNRVKSGVLALDVLCGGGLPCGQLVELFGPASAGKTLLAMLAVAEMQRNGGTTVWIKGEPFDRPWASAVGVAVDKLLLVEGATGDTALETALTLMESGLVNLMVIDSFQSLGTTREMEAGVETESYGGAGAPQLWGRIMRRAYRAANLGKMDDTVLIGISQVRSKIGGYGKGLDSIDGQPSQIKALLHWKGISIRCRASEKTFSRPNNEGVVVAREFKIRCEKNKTAGTEGLAGEYKFYFRPFDGNKFGVNNAWSLFNYCREFGLIDNKGSWFEGFGQRVQGSDAFIHMLSNEKEVFEKAYAALMQEICAKK